MTLFKFVHDIDTQNNKYLSADDPD